MGPLEISGTSSAGAQGKTPSCAADSRGAGERTGPAVPAEAQQPALPAHIPTNAGEAPAAHRTGGGVRSLGKYLLGGKLPARRAVLSRRVMGTLQRRLVHGAVLGQVLCSLRTACSLLQHFSWMANHPQHLPGLPGELSQMPARRGARPHVSQLLALLHEPSAPLCACFPHPHHQPRCFGHRIFSLHLFCSSFHCISATSVDARRFLTAPALLLRRRLTAALGCIGGSGRKGCANPHFPRLTWELRRWEHVDGGRQESSTSQSSRRFDALSNSQDSLPD